MTYVKVRFLKAKNPLIGRIQAELGRGRHLYHPGLGVLGRGGLLGHVDLDTQPRDLDRQGLAVPRNKTGSKHS